MLERTVKSSWLWCARRWFCAIVTPAVRTCLSAQVDGLLGKCCPHVLKWYREPMAHGPEACEPSHPLRPMARGLWAVTPVRKPLTPAVSGTSISNPRDLESDF